MRLSLVKTVAVSIGLVSSSAFPLGLELEFGTGIGKDQLEPRSSTTDETAASAETKKYTEELFGNIVFGVRADPRLLVVHSRTMHLSAGAGIGWERGSGSASLQELKQEYTLNRFLLEPNARLVYFPSRNFGLGLGLGYFFTLTGGFEFKTTMGSKVIEEKQDIDENGGFRMRLFGSYVLPGNNQPQVTAGYQLTTGGSFKAEKATDKSDLSGHSFVVSYVHPIIFGCALNDEDLNNQSQSNSRRSDDKKQRRRRQAPRY